MSRPRRLDSGFGLGLMIAVATLVAGAVPASGGTIQVTAANATSCRINFGPAFGSPGPCSSFNYTSGSTSFSGGYYANQHTVGVTGNGSSSVVSHFDSALVADTTVHPARITLQQQVRYDLTVTIDVLPAQPWELQLGQSISGLFSFLEEIDGDGGGSQFIRWDGSTDIDFRLGGVDYDLDVAPASLGANFQTIVGDSRTAAFSGARNDLITGSGDTVLTGYFRTTISTFSECLTEPSPNFDICNNGPEAALLLGIDDVSGIASISADEYATWGRSVAGDGYDVSFDLTTTPEPGPALLLGLGLVGLAARRRA